ncbi:TldD/PmbA family protein [Geotalea uraniireducens]|uniref:Peptidase C69 n=1 Tax=Geotalea uraniireducens (strain Rf4) TaxID=351605 RepID=A5G7T6_GEOUR|nr:TldD/PmbA family protein [Geotalea uraniireducens]ABQ27854.1 microcin-processing peptidase 2, Unknown type peptidase, MEROPS family U62 [Geotalea uraniireducens Rf4]
MLDGFDCAKILRRALAGGGEFADIYFEEGASTVIACEDGKIEKVMAGADRGVGIRVISDLRTAYAFTNDVTETALLSLAETVSRAVKGKMFEGAIDLRQKTVGSGFPILLPPTGVALQDKVATVTTADRTARGVDPRIRQVTAVYRDGTLKAQVVNSLGEFTESFRTGTVFMVQVVAADGNLIQTGYEPLGGFRGFEIFQQKSPEELALTAAKRGLMMLGARKAPGGMMPVVLSSEAGGTMVHEAIGHGLEADLALTGMSVYSGKIGLEVASPLVTVIDDATIPNARGSFSFDDEGTPGQRTVLVENGILKGYLYDRLNAMKDGCKSTGNGRRESYQAKPIVRMSNTLIAPGATPPEEIIKGVAQGLFVRNMGGGQVNTVNGNFVFEVSEGYLIENGRVTEPVRGATLTGNGPEVLKKITMVGNDLGFGIGTCGKEGQGVPVSDAQPTLLISGITVGGAA